MFLFQSKENYHHSLIRTSSVRRFVGMTRSPALRRVFALVITDMDIILEISSIFMNGENNQAQMFHYDGQLGRTRTWAISNK